MHASYYASLMMIHSWCNDRAALIVFFTMYDDVVAAGVEATSKTGDPCPKLRAEFILHMAACRGRKCELPDWPQGRRQPLKQQ